MIKLHLSGHNYSLTPKIKKYSTTKIGGLDKYLPKKAQDSEATVVLSLDQSGREGNNYVCEATVEVPGDVLQAKEATSNMFAAIDIVEAKLKVQVKKYKQKHDPKTVRKLAERIFRRLGQ